MQKFNDFFVNIGPTLASKIQPSNTNHKHYLCGDNYPRLFCSIFNNSPGSNKATNELANKTSAGYDNISVNFIKKIILHIAAPLSTLISSYLNVALFKTS